MIESTPEFGSHKFQCPHCNVLSQQFWFDRSSSNTIIAETINNLYFSYRTQVDYHKQECLSIFNDYITQSFTHQNNNWIHESLSTTTCNSCGNLAIWIDREMVYPRKIVVSPPNEDMGDDIKDLYHEAAIILFDSPKGSAALLRLALQKLLKHVGKSGKDINADIKELVAEGLTTKLQKALDLVRVIGNQAVHPGEINLDDNMEIAIKLFKILNFISEELITKPKELDDLYNDVIPEKTKEHIKTRDKK